MRDETCVEVWTACGISKSHCQSAVSFTLINLKHSIVFYCSIVFTLILFWHFIPIFIPTFFFLFPHLSNFYVPFTLSCSAWTMLLLKLTVLGSPKIIYYIPWKNTWLGKASVKQHTTTNLGIDCWVDSRVLFKYKIRIIWFDLIWWQAKDKRK